MTVFVEGGGSIEYFVGWFAGRMSGDKFDRVLLRRLADLGISLAFDVYSEWDVDDGGRMYRSKDD